MLFCDCGWHRSTLLAYQNPNNGPQTVRIPIVAQRAAPSGQDQGDLRITGTWDFKWTPGTTIKIAVQALPPGENRIRFDAALQQLRDALEAWIPTRPSSSVPPPNLSWKLLDDLLPAPSGREFPIDLKTAPSARSHPLELEKLGYVDYDVLVSFAPLPQAIPATSEHPVRPVHFPRCELGSYARRTQYGVPTLFLGPHAGFQGDSPKKPITDPDAAARAWLTSPEGKFTVIHELGHVFGLPHEQQNRLFEGKLDWRPMAEMREIARKRNQRTPPDRELEAFIHREVQDLWPADTRFSDWRTPPAAINGIAHFDSVMAKPVYRCFLKNGHGPSFDCKDLEICREEQAAFAALTQPTDSDRTHLIIMYGARP
jgi:hypothetical protein